MVTDPLLEWFNMAGRLSAAEALGVQSGSGKAVLAEFARRESVNPNMLRKMQRARLHIEKNEAERLDVLSRLPLSYVDVLSRVGAIDPGRARDLAARLARDPSGFSYRKLLQVYDDIRADRSKSGTGQQRHKSHVAQFKKDILSAASSGHANILYPGVVARREVVAFRPWKGGHEFVSPFMTSRTKRPGSRLDDIVTTHEIDGYDCYLQYDDDLRELARDRVIKGSAEATFFNRLWFVLPAERSTIYEEMIDHLGPSNLGVLRFCAKSSGFTCTRAPVLAPNPDRRTFWTKHSIAYCAK